MEGIDLTRAWRGEANAVERDAIYMMNYDAWAYSPNTGHVSSRGFVELTTRLFGGMLRNATVESFGVYRA